MKLRNKTTKELTDADNINVKLHKAKVKIGVVAINLAEVGLEGICTRLRSIVKELDDIENILDLQFREVISNEETAEIIGFKKAELEDLEDYIPKEPLIKDEKVRTAVRAWAEASHLVEFQIANDDDIEYQWCQIDGRIDGSTDTHSISFEGIIQGANPIKKYTITELCGETK